MTCKIERVLTPVGLVVFRVSGRIDCAYAEVLRELTAGGDGKGQTRARSQGGHRSEP
jgi:hypothetical protein